MTDFKSCVISLRTCHIPFENGVLYDDDENPRGKWIAIPDMAIKNYFVAFDENEKYDDTFC